MEKYLDRSKLWSKIVSNPRKYPKTRGGGERGSGILR